MTEKESTRLKDKLLKKPNYFDWSKYNTKPTEEHRKHILADPYPCDDCGDTYNKGDLINHFGTRHKICRNCIQEYSKLYK